MSGRAIVLPSALIVSLGFMLAMQASTGARAEECLAKPTGPTPQGQHWYYRISQGRQCWHLGPERGADQQDIDQDETQPAAEPAARTAPKPAAAQAAPEPAKPPSPPAAKLQAPVSAPTAATAAPATPLVAPVPWVNTPSLPGIRVFAQTAPSAPPPVAPSANSSAPGPVTSSPAPQDRSPTPAAEAPSPNDEASARAAEHARRTKDTRRQAVKEATLLPSAPALQSLGDADHVFALLMIVFIGLAITGPALHFIERRRRRERGAFQPPRWAHVASLNTPPPPQRDAVRPPPRQTTRRPAIPILHAQSESSPSQPVHSSDRLAHAESAPLAAPPPEPHPDALAHELADALAHERSDSIAPAQFGPFSNRPAQERQRPSAPAPTEHTERLAEALQQIVNRIQSNDRPVRNTMRVRSSERASG